jgi:Acyl-protein synthetase, LuxE
MYAFDAGLQSATCQAFGWVCNRVCLCPVPCYGRGVSVLYDRVLAFIGDARADRFEKLALDVFAHQFAHSAAYRQYCLGRGHTPDTVADWAAIPPVPIVAFKRADLCCGEAVRTFLSSGTTEGPAHRSRHSVPDLRLSERAAVAGLRQFLFPDLARMRLLSLIHRAEDLPDSSLAQMIAWAMEHFAEANSRYAVTSDGVAFDEMVDALRQSERDGQPLCVLATTGALIRIIDHCREHDLIFRLPHGSRLMDTGGDKGAPRPLSRSGTLHAVWNAFAIPGYFCVNEYGMAELSSQFYDSVITDRVHGRHRPRRKLGPHWTRTMVLDPETLAPTPAGTRGLLCHVDLANAGSAMAVLTEDIGYTETDGFQLVGRVPGAEARGCSLAAAQWDAA